MPLPSQGGASPQTMHPTTTNDNAAKSNSSISINALTTSSSGSIEGVKQAAGRITVCKLAKTCSPPQNGKTTGPLGSINPTAVRRSFSGDTFLNPQALGVMGLEQPLDQCDTSRVMTPQKVDNPLMFPQYTGCRYDRDKPAYSYASLIAQAILDTPDRKLTLNQIYHWIMNKYPYYRSQNSGWQVNNKQQTKHFSEFHSTQSIAEQVF